MVDKTNHYWKNFVVACASAILLFIAFRAFKLDFLHSFTGFLWWLLVLVVFIVVMVILKAIFSWINTDEVINGVWGGVVLYCWAPIFNLPWAVNVWDALKAGSVYFIIGLIVLLWGYFFSRDRNKLNSVDNKHKNHLSFSDEHNTQVKNNTSWWQIPAIATFIILFFLYVNHFQNDLGPAIFGVLVFMMFLAVLTYKRVKNNFRKELTNSTVIPAKFDRAFLEFYVFAFIALVVLMGMIIATVQLLTSLLIINLGPTSIMFMLVAFMMIGYIFILYMPFSLYHQIVLMFDSNRSHKFWFYITLILIVTFILIGSLFLVTTFTPQTQLKFNMINGNQSIDFICGRPNMPLISEEIIPCTSSANITCIHMTYYLTDGQTINRNFTKLKVTFPEKVVRVEIVAMLDEKCDAMSEFSTDTNVYLLSRSQWEEQKKLFLSFFLGLFAVTFVTIPLAIKQLKDLFN